MIIISLATLLWAASASGQELTFLNLDANQITMNGADWRGVRRALPQRSSNSATKFHIVQIGDSHIQPGILSGEARRKLQSRYGNGGRGLIAPLALAGTNEPSNYRFSSSARVAGKSRLMSRSWSVDNGVTGVAVRFGGSTTNLSIKDKSGDAFSSVTLFHAPGSYDSAVLNGSTISASATSQWTSHFTLPHPSSEVTLSSLPCTTAFWGAFLLNDRPGIVYSEIGNNGATYSLYNKIEGFAEQMAQLRPNLIILSMGTNEAVGYVESLESHLDKMVSNLSRTCPEAAILITTPMEFQKRGGRGFVVNSNAHRARDIIMEYGRNHKIAVWDMFSICGGDGCSSKWIANKLMNPRDHLHLLSAGYELQGMMLGDALLKAFTARNL